MLCWAWSHSTIDFIHEQGELGLIPFNPWCPSSLKLKYWAWSHLTLGPPYYFTCCIGLDPFSIRSSHSTPVFFIIYKLSWDLSHSASAVLYCLTSCTGPDPIQHQMFFKSKQVVFGPILINIKCPFPITKLSWAWSHPTCSFLFNELYWAWSHSTLGVLYYLTSCFGPKPLQH